MIGHSSFLNNSRIILNHFESFMDVCGSFTRHFRRRQASSCLLFSFILSLLLRVSSPSPASLRGCSRSFSRPLPALPLSLHILPWSPLLFSSPSRPPFPSSQGTHVGVLTHVYLFYSNLASHLHRRYVGSARHTADQRLGRPSRRPALRSSVFGLVVREYRVLTLLLLFC